MKTVEQQFEFINKYLCETEKITLLLVIEQFHLYSTAHRDTYVRTTMEDIKHKLNLFDKGLYSELKKKT